jgi:hypothetical protein
LKGANPQTPSLKGVKGATPNGGPVFSFLLPIFNDIYEIFNISCSFFKKKLMGLFFRFL